MVFVPARKLSGRVRIQPYTFCYVINFLILKDDTEVCHVRQTLPWSGVVGVRYFWHFFLPSFWYNFGCKVFFASHESRREKSDLRVLTSDAGH